MRIYILSPVLLVAAVSLAACGKNDSAPQREPAQVTAPAPAGADDKAGSNESCLIESPVDETYETLKGTVKNEDKWIRDARELVVTTASPIRLALGAGDYGSGRDVGFEDGVLVDLTALEGVQPKPGSTICALSVQYSNKDFFAMLDAHKKGSQHPYPELILPPGTIRAIQWSAMESTTMAPKSRQPQNQCPVTPSFSKSTYWYGVKPEVKLRYPNGKLSESTIGGMYCEGFNQKGSSIIRAFGRNQIGAVEL